MNGTRGILLGTLAYAGVTFPLAYTWHLMVFADLYQRLGFVTLAEPNVLLGFLTILFQGVLLAAIYPRFRSGAGPTLNGLIFGLAVAAFIWSAATVAHAAKHEVGSPSTFIGMEAAYFLVNFVAYGLLMGRIHRGPERAWRPAGARA